MAETKKVIMAWSQCNIKIAKSVNDAMAAELTSIGNIKEKTTNLEGDLGTPLEAYASGHKLLAREYPDETLVINTTLIEPDEFLKAVGIEEDDGKVRSHYIEDFYNVELTPKHKGAKGIRAPKCQITYTPNYGEETGNEGVLAISIAKTTELGEAENYWYERFTTTTELA